MEAFSLGASPSLDEVPITNGDHPSSASINERIKGLKQWPGGIVRSTTAGSSTPSSKGKGKGVGKEAEGALTGHESDASLGGDEEDMADDHMDGENGEDEDDCVVRTGHLSNAIEKME